MLPGSRKQKIVEAITAICAWAGLTLQLYILLSNVPENGLTYLQAIARFFGYYTILTNLLVAINLSCLLFLPGSRAGKFFASYSVHTAIMLNILLVGLGYNLLLRNTWNPEGLQRIVDELLHVVVPAFYLFYWLFIRTKERIQWRSLITWLAYPLLYMCYALARGTYENWYPYFFIDANKLGYSSVLKNCSGLIIVFIILGALSIAIANTVSSKRKNN